MFGFKSVCIDYSSKWWFGPFDIDDSIHPIVDDSTQVKYYNLCQIMSEPVLGNNK